MKGKTEGAFTVVELEGGRVVDDLNAKIRMAALDVRDREHVGKPRKVTLEVTLTPKDGFVMINAAAKIALPADQPSRTICGMPDDTGNLRSLNQGGAQTRLPINFAVEDVELN
jgi:hypothetical protein